MTGASKHLDIRLERVYSVGPHAGAGYRILVDRLWPRGVSKSEAGLDEWAKDVAPSTALRRWYGHDVQRFAEFARRYRAELTQPPASIALRHLAEVAGARTVVMLTATRDIEHSGAWVLLQSLLRTK